MYEPKDIQNLNVLELMEKINQEIHSRYTDEEIYEICGLPIPQPKPRFEKIKDSMGTWMHDNKTGLDYSCEIGLWLINDEDIK